MIKKKTRMGRQLHIFDPTKFLYPMIGRDMIDKDLSPPRLITKRSMNIFEVLAEKERSSQQNLREKQQSFDD